MTPAKIRKQLNTLSPTTAHARDVKNITIAHLLDYERSVTKGEYCIASLDNAVMGLGWLLSRIVEINDKAVLPSERLALADGYKALFLHYENEKSI